MTGHDYRVRLYAIGVPFYQVAAKIGVHPGRLSQLLRADQIRPGLQRALDQFIEEFTGREELSQCSG